MGQVSNGAIGPIRLPFLGIGQFVSTVAVTRVLRPALFAALGVFRATAVESGPLLEAGRLLRFVMMPDGKDPDDLVRGQGVAAMRELLAQRQTMANLLWQRETEGLQVDSPERQATLDKALEDVVGRIPVAVVRGHYRAEMRARLTTVFGYDVQGAGSEAVPRVVETGTQRLRLYMVLNDDPENSMRECGAVVVEPTADGGLASLAVEHDLFPGSVIVAVIDPDLPA